MDRAGQAGRGPARGEAEEDPVAEVAEDGELGGEG